MHCLSLVAVDDFPELGVLVQKFNAQWIVTHSVGLPAVHDRVPLELAYDAQHLHRAALLQLCQRVHRI